MPALSGNLVRHGSTVHRISFAFVLKDEYIAVSMDVLQYGVGRLAILLLKYPFAGSWPT